MIRVVVADDQELIRTGLTAIIDAEPDLTVVGEAEDGAEAARLAIVAAADVVLMDIEMPGTTGIEGIALLRAERPGPRVLLLTMFDLEEYVFEGLKAGASGFLLKTSPTADMLDAIRAVHQGRQVLAPSVIARLVTSFVQRTPAGSRDRADAAEVLRDVTERELAVIRALTRGMSNAEIAAHLHLSEATVKTYVTRILAKLGLRDRVQLVILAYELGLAPQR
ncbi:response regulator [Microbacterium album]|uniref:DNA-binding response regulator n=1 Tax=Microbacterium album TaxID=2053191 RepID=A0A917IGE2_9MICO|nr:response regulator transcription factor [Microbacterium album]GGH44096.1 DNA-binding response regulator [Microbacterium album]